MHISLHELGIINLSTSVLAQSVLIAILYLQFQTAQKFLLFSNDNHNIITLTAQTMLNLQLSRIHFGLISSLLKINTSRITSMTHRNR